ncbi:short chain aldehyde dehydrogenase 1-like [Euphorbia lathyris]|uniref:short chain aldehyde dehydrogenase 1-like n=1 Tax=Euphorbia lathyris TaxID=212925 RepID=UPI00331356D9
MGSSSSPAPAIKRLEGKVALITGGASGIGKCTARLFVCHGAKVIIADVQSELGQKVCTQIQSEYGETITYINCDVTKETDVEKAVNTAISLHGKLDIMFNNAGTFGTYDPSINELKYENFKKVMDLNVYGGLLGAKHAARVMIPEKKGCILFTASCAAVLYGNTPYAYTASKHAVVGVTKNLAVDLGGYGIRVNCISPTAVVTPMTATLFHAEKVVEEVTSAMASLKGVKVDANDMAEAALFLASDESKFVSGLNLVVDGASHLRNSASSTVVSS